MPIGLARSLVACLSYVRCELLLRKNNFQYQFSSNRRWLPYTPIWDKYRQPHLNAIIAGPCQCGSTAFTVFREAALLPHYFISRISRAAYSSTILGYWVPIPGTTGNVLMSYLITFVLAFWSTCPRIWPVRRPSSLLEIVSGRCLTFTYSISEFRIRSVAFGAPDGMKEIV